MCINRIHVPISRVVVAQVVLLVVYTHLVHLCQVTPVPDVLLYNKLNQLQTEYLIYIVEKFYLDILQLQRLTTLHHHGYYRWQKDYSGHDRCPGHTYR